jgi:hypothetical protein
MNAMATRNAPQTEMQLCNTRVKLRFAKLRSDFMSGSAESTRVGPAFIPTEPADREAVREGAMHWLAAAVSGAFLAFFFNFLSHWSLSTGAHHDAKELAEHLRSTPLLLLAVVNILCITLHTAGIWMPKACQKRAGTWFALLLETLAHVTTTAFGGYAMLEWKELLEAGRNLFTYSGFFTITLWLAVGFVSLSANVTLVLRGRRPIELSNGVEKLLGIAAFGMALAALIAVIGA